MRAPIDNAGKSNVLEAIKRILGIDRSARASDFSEDDVYMRDPDRDIKIECCVDPPVPYKKLQKDGGVAIHRLRFSYNRYKSGVTPANGSSTRAVWTPMEMCSG
jgi:hypothetical protein